VNTGQHYDFLLSEVFIRDFGIPKPDVDFKIGSDTQTKQVARIMCAFEDECDKFEPDLVLVVGDVNSTMACSLVAAKKGIKIIHIEAGIRSRDKDMPEEVNRMVTDAITDYLLPPSVDAVENLKNEGHSDDKIHLVGNVMIDTLLTFQPQIQSSKILEDLGLEEGSYVTLTLHRPSNVDDVTNFSNILAALKEIQKELKIVFPIHPRTKKMVAQFGLQEELDAMPNLILTEPLGYFDFGKLVSKSRIVLTDSGGLQEETTVYGIPCITLRENTERPITITEGTNELAGSDTEKIVSYYKSIMNGDWKKGAIPEFWDGKSAERIVAFINSLKKQS
jgi:UDP-N-acetylglucosamine 2-epimerase (non-hydrolysing)